MTWRVPVISACPSLPEMGGRSGGGLPLTKVSPYDVINGGAEAAHNPTEHHGAARAGPYTGSRQSST